MYNAPLAHPETLSAALAADLFASGYIPWQNGDGAALGTALASFEKYMTQDLSPMSHPDQDAAKILFEMLRGLNV